MLTGFEQPSATTSRVKADLTRDGLAGKQDAPGGRHCGLNEQTAPVKPIHGPTQRHLGQVNRHGSAFASGGVGVDDHLWN